MKVEALYKDIERKGKNKIETYTEEIDEWIGNKNDRRMGIALTIRPTKEIKDAIEKIEKEIKKVEPNQYYYPQTDYHITLLGIITARQGFQYTHEQLENLKKATEEAIKYVKKFTIKLDGIICSGGAIMVKGFYDNEMEHIRKNLRQSILNHHLKLDERYPTMSSHITIGRFKKPIENREGLIEYLQKYNHVYFGEFVVGEIELVYHNWYDSKKEILEKYHLK